jgi:hypothetical protein
MMDVLKFLKGIRSERLEIIRLKEERDTLYYSLLPSGIRYDLDKVQTSPQDRMPGTAAELYEIQEIIDRRIEKLSADVALAHRIIDAVPTPECRELLLLRYLTGSRKPLAWTEIAERMEYSIDHVQGKLHGKAIKEAREVWEREQFRTGFPE